jgi:hypothetical protein
LERYKQKEVIGSRRGGGSSGGGHNKGVCSGKRRWVRQQVHLQWGAKTGSKPPLDRNKEKCHNYGKIDHWAWDCHRKGKKEQAHVTEDDESRLLLVEHIQPSVLVTPALVTISVLAVTTPTVSDAMTLHRTMSPTPARIIELV